MRHHTSNVHFIGSILRIIVAVIAILVAFTGANIHAVQSSSQPQTAQSTLR